MPPKKKYKTVDSKPARKPPPEWTPKVVDKLIELVNSKAMTHKQISEALGDGYSQARVKTKIQALREEGLLPATKSRETGTSSLKKHAVLT